MLVGRGSHCTIQLDDPSSSRVHCRLLARDGKVFLTDAGSRWGTFVNGLWVSESELQPGDEITVGETILRLQANGTSRGTTLARRPEFRRRDGLIGNPAWIESPRHNPDRFAANSQFRSVQDEAPAVPGGTAERLHANDFIGREFAGCDVGALVHQTASGILFKAKWKGADVALKLLHPSCFSNETARKRFLRAIDATQGLRHPNLVELLVGGIHHGIVYAVSEFVEGESAAEVIRRVGVAGMLDWRTVLRVGMDLAAAQEFVESCGIIHRNITPQHILIRESDGVAKLNDLFLARVLDDSEHMLTQAGEIVGEVPYLSPEQVGSGHPISYCSDVYQVGATLYALLTGRPPFEGRTTAEVVQQILDTLPTPPTRYHLAVPSVLEGAIMTMLAKRPGDRFHSAGQLMNDLYRVHRYLPS